MQQSTIDNSEEWNQIGQHDNTATTTFTTDENESFAEFEDWGCRDWLISLTILMVFIVILIKLNGIYISPYLRNENVTTSTVDKSNLEDERRAKLLNLFLSKNNHQKLTSDQIRPKSCRTIDTGSLSTEESQTTIDCHSYCHHDDSDSSLDEEEGLGVVMLSPILKQDIPSNATNGSDTDENHRRSVSNLCAICLEEYYEGETIVWASNKKCPHAFHQDCLVAYLVKVKAQNNYPCPCCRQNFFFDNSKDECRNDKSDER